VAKHPTEKGGLFSKRIEQTMKAAAQKDEEMRWERSDDDGKIFD